MMHQNNRSLWSAETESKLHYKMYKAGKMWLFAGITLFMFGAASGLSTSSAHADTTNAAQSSISATSSTSDDLNTANTSSVTKTSSVDNASATSNTQKSSISATSASSVTVSAVQKSDATNTESKSVVASSEQASDNKLAATTSANETKNADSVTSASSQVSQSEANTKVGNGASTISDNISSQATTSAISANVKVSENQASENVASSTTVKPVESSATLISPNNEQISAVKSKLADMASQTGQAQSFALVDDTTSTTSTTSTQMTGVTLLAQKDAQTLSNISLPTDLTYILSKDRSTLYALSDATYLGTPLLPAYFQGNVIKTVVNETKAQYAQSVINSLASTVQTEVSSDGKGLTAITPGGDNYTTVDFGNYYATISDQTRQQYAQNQIAALPTGLTAHASDNGNTLYIVTPDGYTGKQYGTSDFGQYYQSVEMTTELQYEREVAATAIQALPSGTEITVGGVGDLVKHTLTLTSPAGNPITLSGDATNGYYVTFDVYDNKTGQTLKQQKYFIGTLFSNVQVNTPNSIFSNIANLNTASYGYKDALSDIQYSAVVDWEDMLNHPQTWQGASFPTSGSLLQNDQDTYHQTVYEIAVLFKDYVKQLSQTLPTYFSNADNVKKLISTTSGDWLNFTNPSGKQWSGTSSDTAIAQNVNNWGAGSVFGQGAANPFTPNNQVMADFGKLSTAQITLFPHSGATGLIIDSVAGIPGGWDSSALNTAQSLISGGTLVAAAGHVKFSGLIQTIQMIKNLTQEGLVNGVVLSSLLTLGVNQNDAGWGIPLTDTGLIGTIKKDGLLHFNPTTLSDTGTSYYGIPKSIAAALWFDKNVPDAWLDGLSNEFKNSDNIVSLGHIETDSTNHTHDQDGWQVSIDPVTGLPVGSVNYTEDTAIPSIPFVSKDTIKSTLGLSLKNADNVPTHFDKDTESIYQTLVSTIVSALANQYSQGMQAAYAAMTKMSSTKVSDSNVANGLDGKITTTTWQSDTDQLKQAYDAGYAAALTWLQKYQQQGIADALSGNGAVSDPIGTYQGNMPFSLMKGAAATSTADQIAQIKANTRVSQMLQDAYLNAYNSANKAVTDFSKSTDLSNALTGTSTTGADSYAYLSTYKKIYQAALGNYKVFSTTAGDTASQLAAGPNIVDMAASSVVKASIVNGVYTTVSKIPAGTTISADRMVSPAFSTYLTNTKQTAVASALANVYNKAYNAQIILVNNAYTAGQASLLNDVTKAMTDADDFQNTGKYTAATNFSMPVDSGLTDASGHEIQNHIVYSATQDYTWNTTDKDGTGSQFYKLGYADEQKNVKSINVKYMENNKTVDVSNTTLPTTQWGVLGLAFNYKLAKAYTVGDTKYAPTNKPTDYDFSVLSDDDVNAGITVNLRNGIITVLASAPETEGTAIDGVPGATYPAGVAKDDLNTTSTRTITYSLPEGSTATTPMKATQTVNYVRDATIDTTDNNKVTYGTWTVSGTAQWAAVDSPVVVNYTADKLTIAAADATVPTDSDKTPSDAETVTYSADPLIKVNPTAPKDAGTTVDPKNPDVKYPAGLDQASLNTTSVRTITYTMSDGSKAPDKQTQTVNFSRTATWNEKTGKVTYGTWTVSGTAQWAAVDSPVVVNYTADKLTIAAADATVPTDSDKTPSDAETVTYSADPLIKVNPTAPKDAGTTVDPKNPDVKYPAGLDQASLNTTSVRTITYTMSDGSKAPDKQTQTVNFSRTATWNEKTGKVTYGTWTVSGTAQWAAVDSPVVVNYTADKLTIAAADATVPTDSDKTPSDAETVTYSADPLIKVNPTAPKDAGTTVDPKNPDVKYPAGLDQASLNTTSVRTITYTMSDGSKAPDKQTQTVNFSRTATWNEKTGKVTYGTWTVSGTAQWAAVDSPVVVNYTADKLTIAAADATVPTDSDKSPIVEEFVEYAKNAVKSEVTPIVISGTHTKGELVDPKNPNGPHFDRAITEKDINETLTRKVSYSATDPAVMTSSTDTQAVKFGRSVKVNPETGEVLGFTDWVADGSNIWAAITPKLITNFSPDHENIPEVIVTSDMKDADVNVVYYQTNFVSLIGKNASIVAGSELTATDVVVSAADMKGEPVDVSQLIMRQVATFDSNIPKNVVEWIGDIDFDVPGTYHIEMEFDDPAMADVWVTVTPRQSATNNGGAGTSMTNGTNTTNSGQNVSGTNNNGAQNMSMSNANNSDGTIGMNNLSATGLTNNGNGVVTAQNMVANIRNHGASTSAQGTVERLGIDEQQSGTTTSSVANSGSVNVNESNAVQDELTGSKTNEGTLPDTNESSQIGLIFIGLTGLFMAFGFMKRRKSDEQ